MPSCALYIHWPFCKSKCPYCDFNSHVRDGVDVAQWQQALLAELDHMAAHMAGYTLSSIFFGGGTPSLMPPALVAALIDRASQLFTFDASIEITLEANPTSVESDRFRDFAAAGVNRVSLGVQSFEPDALAFLGREHSANEARRAIELAAHHFNRYSFDLIYARPNQSAAAWEHELREALTLADRHLSLYQLTIEPQTAFHHLYHQKKSFTLPDDEQGRTLFLLTQSIMSDAGLPAYEISNHAVAGEESRHNLAYWTGMAYLGVGPGAHGRLLVDGRWIATATLKSPERWLESVAARQHGIEQWDPISTAGRMQEQLMTGLRLRQGIALGDCRAVIDPDTLAHYATLGLVETKNGRILPTIEGWLVLNPLISGLMAET